MKVETVYFTVGKAIAMRRKQVGLTQEQFARICGLSRASLANIECGLQNVYVHQLIAISNALSLDSVDSLISVGGVLPSRDTQEEPNWSTPDQLTDNEYRQTYMIYSQTGKASELDALA